MRTMFSWSSRAAAMASRSKRAISSGSLLRSWWRILIATGRRRKRCSPSQTVPMPPRPMYRRIVHFPKVCPIRECLLVSIDIVYPFATVAGGKGGRIIAAEGGEARGTARVLLFLGTLQPLALYLHEGFEVVSGHLAADVGEVENR